MARSVENDCVGCPQGCGHCGRDKDYTLITCDFCDEQIIYEDIDKVTRVMDKYDICNGCKNAIQEQLDAFDNALDELFIIGKVLFGEDEWKQRTNIINDLLQGIRDIVE